MDLFIVAVLRIFVFIITVAADNDGAGETNNAARLIVRIIVIIFFLFNVIDTNLKSDKYSRYMMNLINNEYRTIARSYDICQVDSKF